MKEIILTATMLAFISAAQAQGYTAWPGAHLRNPARRWHLCHSGTKAHLHNPTGKRHLCRSIART